MSYGLTLNYSMVEQDGKYEMGFHYNDTTGIDVDKSVAGNDPEDMIYELAADVVAEITEQGQKQLEQAQKEEESKKQAEEDKYVEQLEKIIEDLTAENNSLKVDLNILQRRADDAVKESVEKKDSKKKKSKKIVYQPIFDLFDDEDIPFRFYRLF